MFRLGVGLGLELGLVFGTGLKLGLWFVWKLTAEQMSPKCVLCNYGQELHCMYSLTAEQLSPECVLYNHGHKLAIVLTHNRCIGHLHNDRSQECLIV